MNAGVSSEKEKIEESQSRSVTPSLDTPSSAGSGRHIQSDDFHYKVSVWFLHLQNIKF